MRRFNRKEHYLIMFDFFPSIRPPSEKESMNYCTHCWIPITKSHFLRIQRKQFCSFNCFIKYYHCILTLFVNAQKHRLKIYLLHKKNWSTGIFAGLILAFLLLGFLALILSSPITTPPEIPPVSEAMFNITELIPSPFFPLELDKGPDTDKKNIKTQEYDMIEDVGIKNLVRMNLVKDYPFGRQKTIGISGHAPDGSICALYLNNKLHDVTICIKGTFFFPRVTVHNGVNVFEVMAYDSSGKKNISNIIELFVDRNNEIIERGKNITRGSLKNKRVCLTFDGGASASCAPEILDILGKYKIKCTFFLTGDFIRNHPKLVKKMVKLGHEIGNHTDTHPHLAKLDSNGKLETLPWVSKDFLHNQLKKTEEAFFQVTRKRMAPFWRSPYGEYNLQILKWAEEIGYCHIGWTCGRVLEEGLDTLDWVYNAESPIYYSAEEIKDKIVNFGQDSPDGANGGIILMHLASSRPVNDRIHLQLPSIINGLYKRGYHFAKISENLDVPYKSEEKDKSQKTKRGRRQINFKGMDG